MKKILTKLASILPALAMIVGVASLNSACSLTYHQPEVPTSLDKYRK